jgi:hypothetical protein
VEALSSTPCPINEQRVKKNRKRNELGVRNTTESRTETEQRICYFQTLGAAGHHPTCYETHTNFWNPDDLRSLPAPHNAPPICEIPPS